MQVEVIMENRISAIASVMFGASIESFEVGDDLFVTNESRLDKVIENKLRIVYSISILIKPNKIGTLADLTVKQNGYKTIISHRSTETEDTTIANITVATNVGKNSK